MAKNLDKRVVLFRNIVLVVVIASAIAIALIHKSEKGKRVPESEVAALATCLSDKGVKMYGAAWCAHCQRQKKLFGDAFESIDYIECAVPGDPRAQSQECQEAGVTSYPTWEFAPGDRQSGEMQLDQLAAKAGCPWGQVADTNPDEISPAEKASPAAGPDGSASPAGPEGSPIGSDGSTSQ